MRTDSMQAAVELQDGCMECTISYGEDLLHDIHAKHKDRARLGVV